MPRIVARAAASDTTPRESFPVFRVLRESLIPLRDLVLYRKGQAPFSKSDRPVKNLQTSATDLVSRVQSASLQLFVAFAPPHPRWVEVKDVADKAKSIASMLAGTAGGPTNAGLQHYEESLRCYQDWLNKLNQLETEIRAVATAPTADEQLQEIALTDNDMSILRALALVHPLALKQADLEARSGVSRRTIGESIPRLSIAGLVCKVGERKGTVITEKGLQIIRSIPAAP